ncbi:MAG TPA: rhodanese-like domain-containing protein [Anaerolineales bacterium]|nr:rhodanese-like domain-containing protein [Anaerolineales bacterium]HLB47432.1 rhodanese-like domain-containing protein [Anaerolineales bacterium]
MPFLNPPVLAIRLGLLAAAILFLFLRRFLSPSGIVEVTPQEAQARVKAGAQLIDVRQPAEFRTGHAPKAKMAPLSQLKRHVVYKPALIPSPSSATPPP